LGAHNDVNPAAGNPLLFVADASAPPDLQTDGKIDLHRNHRDGKILAFPCDPYREHRGLRLFVDEEPPAHMLEAVVAGTGKQLLHLPHGRLSVFYYMADEGGEEFEPEHTQDIPPGDYLVSVLRLQWKEEDLKYKLEQTLGKGTYREYTRLQKKQAFGCALTVAFCAFYLAFSVLPRSWQQSISGVLAMVFVEIAIMWAVIIFLNRTPGARRRAEHIRQFNYDHPSILVICQKADEVTAEQHRNVPPPELDDYMAQFLKQK
jgi:hypothetical protein